MDEQKENTINQQPEAQPQAPVEQQGVENPQSATTPVVQPPSMQSSVPTGDVVQQPVAHPATTPEPTDEKKGPSKLLLIFLVIFLFVLLGVGGWYYWQNYMQPKPEPVVVEKPTPTSVPTPTLSPEEEDIEELDLGLDELNKELEEIEQDVEQL